MRSEISFATMQNTACPELDRQCLSASGVSAEEVPSGPVKVIRGRPLPKLMTDLPVAARKARNRDSGRKLP